MIPQNRETKQCMELFHIKEFILHERAAIYCYLFYRRRSLKKFQTVLGKNNADIFYRNLRDKHFQSV